MWFYNCGIFFYFLFIKFASLFNHKAKLWVRGRKNIFEQIEGTLKDRIRPGDKVIWFHCASLGEFEQGRPVLERLKQSGVKIVLTFFSPSGYEIRKDYGQADAVFYLPIDFRTNAEKFIALVNPDAAVFVKYEFWLNYLAVLDEKKIPTYLVSGAFRPGQHFFKWYGKRFFKALETFKTLFVQDENSLRLLKEYGFTNGELAGDTRFDRVMQIARNKRSFPEIEEFCGASPVLIAGSSWPKDEELILSVVKKLKQAEPDLKLIIVPHEIDEASLNGTIGRVKSSGLNFAKYTQGNFTGKDVLIVDTIGMLSQIYQYATLAYVGGGFNNGIHNILEVFAHDVPVAFGPNYHKFVEANDAEKLLVGRPIYNEAELFAFCSELIPNEVKRKALSTQINAYMNGRVGATEKIYHKISRDI